VTIYFDDDKDDTETFLLGSREIASTTELTVYSPESALGQSILGARTGDTVTYTAPNGKDIKVTIVTFAPFTG
jgi:transcription elongation factor GreA